MDEPKQPVDNPEDMVIGTDGVLNDTASNENQAAVQTEVSPQINEVTPPPAPEISTPEEQTIEVKVAPQEEVETESHDKETENLAPVASAPAEEKDSSSAAPEAVPPAQVENPGEPVVSAPNDSVMPQIHTDNNEQSAAPAVMGVAASQMNNKHPHRNNKKLAAVVTVIVAALLAGIVIFVYLRADSNTANQPTPVASPRPDEPEANSVDAATADDVDQTIKNNDAALNGLDESADFTDEDLSDSTLGL